MTMTTNEEILGTDVNGRVDYSLGAPTLCRDVVLEADVAKSATVPVESIYNRAFFSYDVGTNVWVTLDGTDPEVPTEDGDSTQELNPSIRQVKPGGTIKMISETASHVNIRYDRGA